MNIFTEKIHGKKLIHYRTESGIRLVVGQHKTFFEVLETSINTYLIGSKAYNSFKNIKCKQSVMNAGIRIIVCDYSITVGQAFRLYNEIIEVYNLDTPVYGKLFYEQDMATEISPL